MKYGIVFKSHIFGNERVLRGSVLSVDLQTHTNPQKFSEIFLDGFIILKNKNNQTWTFRFIKVFTILRNWVRSPDKYIKIKPYTGHLFSNNSLIKLNGVYKKIPSKHSRVLCSRNV